VSERSGAGAGIGAPGSSNGAGEPLPSDPGALEKLIDARREHLAATVDELARRARPKEIARRAGDDALTRLRSATYTTDGRLRVERVAAVGAAVVALLALVLWRRRSR
jgi:anti-sigma-K factor RskA